MLFSTSKLVASLALFASLIVLLVLWAHTILSLNSDSSRYVVAGGPAIKEHVAYSKSARHPLEGLIRSFPSNAGHHIPTQKRTCLSFTAVPKEMETLRDTVDAMLALYNESTVQCVHISIPERALRFHKESYPSTLELQDLFDDARVILHRLFDYGPMTRYIGPLAYEQHPDTSVVTFDMDSSIIVAGRRDLKPLISAASTIDRDALWCYQGEDFRYDGNKKETRPHWDTYRKHNDRGLIWNRVFFCRGVGGLLFKIKHFDDFWFNQSEYHESCFYDDDRWIGFQMERIKIECKALVPVEDVGAIDGIAKRSNNSFRRRRLGSLTSINNHLKSDQSCPRAWLDRHSEAFPLARESTT